MATMAQKIQYVVNDLNDQYPTRRVDEEGLYSFMEHLEKVSGRNRDVRQLTLDDVILRYMDDYWMEITKAY